MGQFEHALPFPLQVDRCKAPSQKRNGAAVASPNTPASMPAQKVRADTANEEEPTSLWASVSHWH